MLDFLLGKTRDCEGVNRREFLRVGGCGLLGLTLPGLLQSQSRAKAEGIKTKDDISLIVLWMQGGPSHIDTFDPKPDAPAEYRGEFGVVNTKLPGVKLCEHLPNLAQNIDKFSIIRSGYCYNGSHGVADAYMLSGWKFSPATVFPTYGSVVANELGYRKGMPPFVQIGTSIDRRFGGGVAGFLGSEFNPFEISADPSAKQFVIEGVTLPNGMTTERFARRRKMLDKLDQWQEQVEKSSDSIEAMDAFYEKAFGMVTSPATKKAFDISMESNSMRDAYGRNRFGQSCLLARRLVQAGVRVITITDSGWDTHQGNFTALKRKLPVIDQGYAALLKDLKSQGMLDNTMVLWVGDFGRTPKVNASAGRDHWVGSTVFCLGGGGIHNGRIIGESSEFAEQPATDPIRIEDIAATMYTQFGIPVDKHYTTSDGRPVRVNDGGRVLTELLV